MNKNIIKLFAILVMIFMVGAIFVGCGADGKDGKDGVDGKDGINGADGKDGADGEDGEDAYVCENHVWNSEVIVISEHYYDATTGKDYIGSVLKVCDKCGWAEIAKDEHVFTEVVTAPTCTEEGYTTKTCTTCGYTTIDVASVVPALGHKVAVEFDADNVDTTVWKLAPNTSGLCDCVAEPVYTADCERCGIADIAKETGKAPGHVYGPWEDTINDSSLPVCEIRPSQVAVCTVCQHETEECMDHQETAQAPGHKWSDWTVLKAPTATEAGTIIKTCSVCAAKFEQGTETKSIPALNAENVGENGYTYEEKADVNCTEAGKGVYTIVVEGTTLTFNVAKSHNVEGSTDYEVTVKPDGKMGTVKVKCVDCDAYVELALPDATDPMYSRFYQFVPGNCIDVTDTYIIPLTDMNGEVEGTVVVTFTLEGDYEHDAAPAKEDCEKVEGEEYWYYIYKCNKCNEWIVAYADKK